MDSKNFQEGFPGRLVKIPVGVFAFVPDPLPPKGLDVNSVRHRLSEADRAVGTLAGIGSTPTLNPYLIIGPLQKREALSSSRLEGTVASAKQLAMFDAAPTRPVKNSDIREVSNYRVAMDTALARRKDMPVCNRLIREAHKQLLTGVRGRHRNPGSFRNTQNHIGTEESPIELARFVPPPVQEMLESLHDLENYMQNPYEPEPLVKLALIHYQFEAIHPFLDGNGRIGRLLITLLLCDWSLLPVPLLYMSSYFEKHRTTYKDLLLAVSQTGGWNEWIDFFLEGVLEQSADAAKRARMLLNLREHYRQILQSTQRSTHPLTLIDELFHSPAITAERTRQLLRVTPATAQATINRLVEIDFLQEATGRTRNRIYIAPGILEIIEKDSID